MALNWTMLSQDRSPVPLTGEDISRAGSAADLTITIPRAPPSGSSSSGGVGGSKTLQGSGTVWLTSQRLIFVNNAKSTPPWDTLNIPLTAILSTKFEQPLIGKNYLAIEIKPVPEGGLTNGTKAELRLKDQGLFEFVGTLEKTRERAIYMRRQSADEEEGLPSYSTPAGPSTVASPAPPPSIPDEAPPGYDAPSYA